MHARARTHTPAHRHIKRNLYLIAKNMDSVVNQSLNYYLLTPVRTQALWLTSLSFVCSVLLWGRGQNLQGLMVMSHHAPVALVMSL